MVLASVEREPIMRLGRTGLLLLGSPDDCRLGRRANHANPIRGYPDGGGRRQTAHRNGRAAVPSGPWA